ncbi:MAG: phage protease [Azonexus sp.]|nr:phage protease [Azonexus sp.]
MSAPLVSSATASSAVALAALAVDLAAAGGVSSAPPEFRLLPWGRFKAADGSGRPTEVPAGWLLEQEDAARLCAAFNARSDARVIDFEHQTLNAQSNGQPAPAAGWIGKLEARADGLYAVGVEWTARAAAMIAAREYRYISPVFPYDKKTGRVLAVLFAALTNHAGLDGLTDLAALTALAQHFLPPEKESPAMKELLKALGLAETATEAEALAALAALKAAQSGELAALKATPPDPAQYVAIATLTALQGEKAALASELAALKAEQVKAAVDAVIADGLAAGKLTPATEPHARKLAGDLAALKGFIDAQPVVVKPGQTQTGGVAPAGKPAMLDAAQAALCAKLGLKPEDFLAAV